MHARWLALLVVWTAACEGAYIVIGDLDAGDDGPTQVDSSSASLRSSSAATSRSSSAPSSASAANSSSSGLSVTLLRTVPGTAALELAGRTDVAIPPLGETSATFPLQRHDTVEWDFLVETFPVEVQLSGATRVSVAASGQVDFYVGHARPYSPDGDSITHSDIDGVAGLSGYGGASGALAGVFLDDSNPVFAAPPVTLFGVTLQPALRQLFFIGSGGAREYVAPPGATRLFLGFADARGFAGAPGFFEDNDGELTAVITLR